MTDNMTDAEKQAHADRSIMLWDLEHKTTLPSYAIQVDWNAIAENYAVIDLSKGAVSMTAASGPVCDCSIADAAATETSRYDDYRTILRLEEELEAKDAKFKEKSKEYDEILAEKNHQLDVLRDKVRMLESKINYCKKHGIWAEESASTVSAEDEMSAEELF